MSRFATQGKGLAAELWTVASDIKTTDSGRRIGQKAIDVLGGPSYRIIDPGSWAADWDRALRRLGLHLDVIGHLRDAIAVLDAHQRLVVLLLRTRATKEIDDAE